MRAAVDWCDKQLTDIEKQVPAINLPGDAVIEEQELAERCPHAEQDSSDVSRSQNNTVAAGDRLLHSGCTYREV
jgi:hypothetical protein